jgi:hypothetical protein
MKKNMMGLAYLLAMLVTSTAWADLFNSCDGASKTPMPEWVSKPDFSLKGFYAGVGSADKVDANKKVRVNEDRLRLSEENAKKRLVEAIEVKIIAETKQDTQVNGQTVKQESQSKITASSEEVLRGLKIKEQWLDKDTCTQHTLMVISEDAVKQAKRERLMKTRFELFKVKLADGEDRNTYSDINVRRKLLEEAQSLLADTDLNLLQEAEQGKVYAKRMSEAMARLVGEMSQVKGRMAMVALNADGSLKPKVIGKMLDQLKALDNTADRLMDECSTDEECQRLASSRGFTKLALLKASSNVGISPMGSLKGTLTITRIVYDLEKHKRLPPQTVSAFVIGWGDEEMDWLSAVEKAMQGLN